MHRGHCEACPFVTYLLLKPLWPWPGWPQSSCHCFCLAEKGGARLGLTLLTAVGLDGATENWVVQRVGDRHEGGQAAGVRHRQGRAEGEDR